MSKYILLSSNNNNNIDNIIKNILDMTNSLKNIIPNMKVCL